MSDTEQMICTYGPVETRTFPSFEEPSGIRKVGPEKRRLLGIILSLSPVPRLYVSPIVIQLGAFLSRFSFVVQVYYHHRT